MVERGLAVSRSLAQRLVMAGEVRVNGQLVLKAATTVAGNADITIAQPPPYVSRGGEKLAAALQSFPIPVKGKICADVGASTGGFSDCLLQHGAKRVYAIDVGKGILHWKLRQNSRVIVMEETNARYLEKLPESVDLVTVDASFISLKILLPVAKGWFPSDPTPPLVEQDGTARRHASKKRIDRLIRPQFEAGRSEVTRGDGVIRDPVVHHRVLEEMLQFAQSEGYAVLGVIRSPLTGPKGNIEFLAWLEYPSNPEMPAVQIDLAALTEQASGN